MIPLIVELSGNIYVPADNKQHNYIYTESRQNQLATNSIEILMIHLKKIGGRKLLHINFCGGSFRPPWSCDLDS
jgi:hypothetical protein